MPVLRPAGGLLLLLFIMGLTQPGFARAELFQTARTLKPGSLSLGIEPQVFLTSTPLYELNFFGGVGVAEGVDLGIRYGLPLSDPLAQYFGADVEVRLLAEERIAPSISLTAGGHVLDWRRFGLDGTLMVSKVFRRVEPYLALDCDVSLPPDVIEPSWRAVGGLNVHASRVVEVMLELGLGLDETASYLSLGLNFYI